VVGALIALQSSPQHAGQVFNLGSDQEISIAALARRVIEVCQSESLIESISYEKAYGQAFDDLARRVPKLDRIRQAIHFAPRYQLDEIIQSVMKDQQRDLARVK
jgi:UDP-glucose 4-epimerase